jgi:hypothetical protein
MVGRLGLVVVQHFHVRRHGLDELFQCQGQGMSRAKGHQEEKTKPFELSLRLVVRVWDVDGFVVDYLMDLAQVARSGQKCKIMSPCDLLKRRQVFTCAATELVAIDACAKIVRVVGEPVTSVELLSHYRWYNHAYSDVAFSERRSADVLFPSGSRLFLPLLASAV